MATKTKAVTAGKTVCVYLRGSACSDAFIDDYCFRYFLLRLFNGLSPYQVELHAYAMFSNERFLLVTPRTSTGLNLLLNSVSESYNCYFDERFERTSSPMGHHVRISETGGEALTFDCQKYIERRALDNNIRQHAGAYQWSSYNANSFGCRSKYVKPHKAFSEYLKTGKNRFSNYRDFIAAPFNSNYLSYLDRQLRSGNPLAKRRKPENHPVTVRRKVFNQQRESNWV